MLADFYEVFSCDSNRKEQKCAEIAPNL